LFLLHLFYVYALCNLATETDKCDLIWFDTPRLFASVIDCPVWVYRTYLLAYVYSSSNSLFSNPSGIYLPRIFIEMEDTNLDASLFVGPALDSAWSQRCDDLRRAVDRMRNISSQKALILLRASFSAPCMLYVQGPPCARKLEALARATFGIPSGSKFPNVSIFLKFLNVLACHFHEDLFWYCTRLDSNMLIPNEWFSLSLSAYKSGPVSSLGERLGVWWSYHFRALKISRCFLQYKKIVRNKRLS